MYASLAMLDGGHALAGATMFAAVACVIGFICAERQPLNALALSIIFAALSAFFVVGDYENAAAGTITALCAVVLLVESFLRYRQEARREIEAIREREQGMSEQEILASVGLGYGQHRIGSIGGHEFKRPAEP